MANAPILVARLMRAGGRPLEIWVVKGHFSTSDIEPQDQWTALGSHLLLVSSVDEKENSGEEVATQGGGLHASVDVGCGLQAAPSNPIAAGNLSLQTCRGPYNRFGISDVADIAVVVGRDVASGVSCIEYSARGEDADYQRCLTESAAKAVHILFGELFGKRDKTFDGVILPGLGTGIGGMNAEAFYDPLFAQIVSDAKEATGAAELPANIYLLVDNAQSQEDQERFYRAIGAASSQLLDWQTAPHPPGSTERLTLTGLAGGTALTIIGVILIRRSRSRAPEIWLLVSRPSLALVIGWIAMSLGVATAITPLVAVVSEKLLPWGQIAIGFLAAPAGPYLYRALRSMEEMLKPVSRPARVNKGRVRD